MSYLDSIRKEYEQNSVNLGNKFKLTFFGGGSATPNSEAIKSMVLRLKEVDLPMMSVATRSHKPYGNGYAHKSPYYDINLGNDNTFTSLVTMSKDLREREIITSWINSITNNMQGYVAQPIDYKYTAVVSVFTMDGALSYQLEMTKVFPVSVEAQRLTVEGTAPLELSVVWAFDKIKTDSKINTDIDTRTFDDAPSSAKPSALAGLNSLQEDLESFTRF